MNSNLKKIIFRKLFEDLSHVEIIPYKNNIWFIDREEKYWYFLFDQNKILWWRFDFFSRFFGLFSLERKEFEPILSEWVEWLLNYKIYSSAPPHETPEYWLKYVLNYEVGSFAAGGDYVNKRVEEVLSHKIESTKEGGTGNHYHIEQVLSQKVISVRLLDVELKEWVEETINFNA